MKLFWDLKIGVKLWMFAGFTAAALLVFAAMGLATLNRAKVNGPVYREIVLGKDLIADVLPPPEYIIETYLLVLQMTDETDADKLASMNKTLVRLQGEFDTRHEYWTENLAESDMKETLLVASYEPAVHFYDVMESEFLPAVDAGDREKAVSLANGELKEAHEEHRAAIDEVVAMSVEFTANAEADARSIISSSTRNMAFIAVAFLAAISVFSFVLSKYVSSSVRAIGGALHRISTGDLGAEVKIKANDEIGDMGRAYAEMRDYLQEASHVAERVGAGDLTVSVKPRSEGDVLNSALATMITSLRSLVTRLNISSADLAAASHQLSQTAEQTGQASQGITVTSQQVARGAEEQSKNIHETTGSISELAKTIRQVDEGSKEQLQGVSRTHDTVKQVAQAAASVAKSAQQATQAAREASKSAGSGREMVTKTVDGMARMREAVESATTKISGLGHKSAEIGKIVAVIGDIASQTNLLALNAAIEAARAGDQGRGFAVVADEVRTLAERASQATKEITALIEAVQKGVQESVAATQEGSTQVAEGSKLVEKAGAALGQIIDSVTAVAVKIEEISKATEQVAASSDEVVKSIEGVSKIAQVNANAARGMNSNSDQVSKAMESISAVIEESSAAAEQASAGAEEMTAQVEEVVAAAQSLSQMATDLKAAVAVFKLDDDGDGAMPLFAKAA